MFERFTQAAGNTVFFAREEAERLGSEQIETEHLLLGVFAEEALTNYLLGFELPKKIRSQIEQKASNRKKDASDIEPSLSEECKAILALGAAEADRLGDKHIGNEHLLLGLLTHSKCYAAQVLSRNGASLGDLRQQIAKLRSDPDLEARIGRGPPPRIDWSEYGIPDGYAYPKLLYNPASETLIVQLEGVDEPRPKRLYMKRKDAPKYERIGNPDEATSYDKPVTSVHHPLLAFNVETWQKVEQGVAGDWKEVQVLDLKTRASTHSVKKGELILPQGFRDGWISDLIALADDGARLYVRAALRGGPRSRVTYFLAILDLGSKRLETLSELRAVFF